MIPYIEASGSSWDIGHTIGSKLKDKFQSVTNLFEKKYEKSLHNTSFEKKIKTLLLYSEQYAPSCVEELRGMAEGAEIPFLTLFSSNAAQEIPLISNGCSSLAVPQMGTKEGTVLLAHNEDNDVIFKDCTYLIKGEPYEEPTYLAFAYYGKILHQGFNEKGIASVGNALSANDIKLGIPKLLAYRNVLRSIRIEDAINCCIKPERANGNNHIIANEYGEIYDLEVSATKYGIKYSRNSFMAHTNHFTIPEMKEFEIRDYYVINSCIRLNRLERLLEMYYKEINIETLKKILSDHSNYPKSICVHSPEDIDDSDPTIGCVIIDLTNRRMIATAGNPCKGEFREVHL